MTYPRTVVNDVLVDGGKLDAIPSLSTFPSNVGKFMKVKSETEFEFDDINDNFQYKTTVTVGTSDADYVCDGVDDQVQIQEAIDYVSSLGGGIIRVKKGTYNLGIQYADVDYEEEGNLFNISIVLKSKCRLVGDGIENTIFKIDYIDKNYPLGISIENYTETVFDDQDHDMSVEDISFYGNAENFTPNSYQGGTFFYPRSCNNVMVKDCSAYNTLGTSFKAQNSSFLSYIRCRVYEAGRYANNVGQGIFTVGCDNVYLEHCYTQDTYGNGFRVQGGNNIVYNNLFVNGTQVKTIGREGMKFDYDITNLKIINPIILNATKHGIIVQADAGKVVENVSIINPIIKLTDLVYSGSGVNVAVNPLGTLTNFHLEGGDITTSIYTGYPFWLDSDGGIVQDCSIRNCVFDGGGISQSALVMEYPIGWTIENNTFRNSTTSAAGSLVNLYRGTNFTFRGNKLYGGNDRGLWIRSLSSEDVFVNDNYIDTDSPKSIEWTGNVNTGTFLRNTVKDAKTVVFSATTTNFLTDGIINYTETISANGALNPFASKSLIDTTSGSTTNTLAIAQEGMCKTITMITDGGDATLTPSSVNGYTSIVFNDVGDTVELLFTNGKWNIVSYYGCTINGGTNYLSDSTGLKLDQTTPQTTVGTFTFPAVAVTNNLTVDTNTLFVDATNNRVGIGTTTPDYKFTIIGTGVTDMIRTDIGIDIKRVSAPASVTGAIQAGAGLEVGRYYYRVSYLTALGESTPKISAAINTTAGNQQILLTLPVSTDHRVTGRRIYRCRVDDFSYLMAKLIDINNNTDTTYLDSTPDASLPSSTNEAYYKVNTTTRYITVEGQTAMNIDSQLTTLGFEAGNSILGGVGGENTYIGYRSGSANSTSGRQTFIGSASGRNASGADKICVGVESGGNSTSSNTIHVGDFSGSRCTGTGSVFVGGHCGYTNTVSITGTGNIAMGYQTMLNQSNNFTGSKNIFIGYQCALEANGQVMNVGNTIVLGNTAFSTKSNQVVLGNSSVIETILRGDVLMTTADSNKLLFGAGKDMSLYYDGTNGYITTNDIAPSDLKIACGTDKTLELQETVWDDMRVVPGSFDRPGISDPNIVAVQPGGSGTTTYLYEFAKNDIASFTIQLPHGYKPGTDIYAHIHWTPGTRGNEENGATVGWKLDYTWASLNSNFGTMTTLDLSDACDGTDWKHQMTPDIVISGTGQGISSMLICNIKRTDTGTDDTWAGTASGQLPLLLEIDFHYQIDTIGSRQIGVK
jgi:hypothetical protein